MKGENDHQLRWPFEHDVTYRILNWKTDENHLMYITSFKYASVKYKQRVTSQERAKGGHGHDFPFHSSISDGAAKDAQYLHNDCLCLQVMKIESPK